MKHVLPIILALAFFFALNAQQSPRTLNLQTAIVLALKYNLDAKQGQLLMKTADIRKRQAVHDLLPDVNDNINHGMNQGRSIDPFTNTYNNQKINYAS